MSKPIEQGGQLVFPDNKVDTLTATETRVLLDVLRRVREGKTAILRIDRHGVYIDLERAL